MHVQTHEQDSNLQVLEVQCTARQAKLHEVERVVKLHNVVMLRCADEVFIFLSGC